VWRWDNTEPFGDSVPNGDPNGTGSIFDMPLGFAGQYRDREIGPLYNYYRNYDPATGRYVQSDPIGLMAGPNTYVYVEAKPVSYADPSGLDAIFVHFIGYDVGLPGNISVPFGHSGAIAVDPLTGKTRYYDFGRYGGKCGNVRGPFDVGKISFDRNGNPTKASIEAVLGTASAAYGKSSPTYYEYSKKPYQDVIDYAERRRREADSCQHKYNFFFDNCNNFGREAAGR
jgi:RHS repeat-associated protein